MANRTDHVLADAERGDGIIASEDIAVIENGIVALFQLRITKRKRFVTRKCVLLGNTAH